MPTDFSLSAYQAWQRCEQRYYYQYRLRLRSAVKDAAPVKGNILHDYLAAFYLGLKNGETALLSHGLGIEAVRRWDEQVNLGRALALHVQNYELAANYAGLLDACESIASRHYNVHGAADSERYDVLMVEEKLRVSLVAGIWTTGVIDLVLRERANGVVWLCEHKSATEVPPTSLRIRDMQTLLYAKLVERKFKLHIDGILWNYLRTKMPAEPEVLKSGGLSKRKDADTTWEVYANAIAKNALNVADYSGMYDILKDKETEVFFPRYEHVIVADTKTMLSDFTTEGQRARLAAAHWDAGKSHPIRTLNRDCDWCSYYKLCEAALTGGDEETVINMYYTTEREGKPNGGSSTTGTTTADNVQASGAETSVQPDYLRPLWSGQDEPVADPAG